MRSYKLVETLTPAYQTIPPTTGLLSQQQLLEAKAMQFWESDYSIDEIDQYTSTVCEGNLLLEFSLKDFIFDNLSNVLQAAIGAALEGGISVGTLGAGTPAGIAAEAANDLVFFGMEVVDVVSSIKGVFQGLAEIKDAIMEIFSNTIENTPMEIYESVQTAIETVAEKADEFKLPIRKYLDKLGEALNKMIRKIAKVAADGIAVFIPAPDGGFVIQNMLAEFADDAYLAFIKIYEQIPPFLTEWFHDTDKLKDGMMSIYDAAVEWLEGYMSGKEDGILAKGLEFITAGSSKLISGILSMTGAAEKIIKWIRGSVPGFIDKAIDALSKIYPLVMGGLCGAFVLARGDY